MSIGARRTQSEDADTWEENTPEECGRWHQMVMGTAESTVADSFQQSFQLNGLESPVSQYPWPAFTLGENCASYVKK